MLFIFIDVSNQYCNNQTIENLESMLAEERALANENFIKWKNLDEKNNSLYFELEELRKKNESNYNPGNQHYISELESEIKHLKVNLKQIKMCLSSL